MIQSFSDEALAGAIRQLAMNRDWPSRLRELLIERDRRNGKTRNPRK
jgi:hypothetical protein